MKIEILDRAKRDLIDGFHFYEAQHEGLGTSFLDRLYSDIESLRVTSGAHLKAYNDYHRLLSGRFPFAVYYTVQGDATSIHAVVDCRRDPVWIRQRLK